MSTAGCLDLCVCHSFTCLAHTVLLFCVHPSYRPSQTKREVPPLTWRIVDLVVAHSTHIARLALTAIRSKGSDADVAEAVDAVLGSSTLGVLVPLLTSSLAVLGNRDPHVLTNLGGWAIPAALAPPGGCNCVLPPVHVHVHVHVHVLPPLVHVHHVYLGLCASCVRVVVAVVPAGCCLVV